MTPLNTALQWLDLGIATIPIKYYDKKPNFRLLTETGDISEDGKAEWNPYKERLPESDKLKVWFRSRFVNIAIITGWQNLVIIDFDDPSIWQLWQPWIDSKMPELLKSTYRVKTRRGQHIYLFVKNHPENSSKIQTTEENPKDRTNLIDIKAAGGYCLIPPSIHPSGFKYGTNGHKPTDIMAVDSLEDVLPSMLLERSVNYVDICLPESKPVDVWEAVPNNYQENSNPIEWIKRNRNISEFFPNAIRGNNGFYSVLCPFHQDNKTSAWINPTTNRFGCIKGCYKSIDIIDFYCFLKNIDRSTSVRELSR